MSGGGQQARILIVDDEPLNIKVLVDLLRPSYGLLVAKNGEQALERMQSDPVPDLVLLDVMMPGMDGHEVCRRIKACPRTAEVPVIFVSAMGETDDETNGFSVGAVDYITKPISPPVVLARVKTHLNLRLAQRDLADYNSRLEATVAQRTREVQKTQDVTIRALASLAETRDNETGNHIRRTQYYVRLLAEKLRENQHYADALTDRTIDLIFKSAPLHDVGKVGIPDAILLKPGKLTPEEFEIMKRHAELGRSALVAAAGDETCEDISFLRYACEVAGSHHEKWNGQGYPEGLAGEQIPLSARLMAIADVYDALISKRVYKPPFSHPEAVRMIEEGSGTHFDPQIVDAFLAVADGFATIAADFADRD